MTHAAAQRVNDHPLAEVRAEQEASELKSRLSALIYQGIIDRLSVAPIHADELEPLYPPEHRDICRRLAPAQFGSLASRHYIQKIGERKSKFRSRNAAKSGIYELTRTGRQKLTSGLDAEGGASPLNAPLGPDTRQPVRVESGEEKRPVGDPLADESRGAGSGATFPASEPGRLFEPEPERPLSPFRDQEAA